MSSTEAEEDAPSAWTTEPAPEDGGDDDFGDFEEGDVPAETSAPTPVEMPSLPLCTDAQDPRMRDAIRDVLPYDFTHVEGVQGNVVEESMRQVEGLSQILVSERSRALFRELSTHDVTNATLDWRRSHTRRQYLISLGVPINLDEMQGPTKKVLPPLELHVNSPSDHARDAAHESLGDRRRREMGLQEPSLPTGRIETILHMSEDDIKLLTLPELRELVREAESLSKRMGDALQYHLVMREAFTSDSEMFHGIIRDLVVGASHKVAARAKQDKRSGLLRPLTPGAK